MKPDTAIPVRLKSRGEAYIGNEEETLSGHQNGWTEDVIWATAESVLTSPVVDTNHRRVLARAIDDSILEYDSYEDEVNSPLGRSAQEIALQEGWQAYQELKDEIRPNPYLYAAVHEVPVAEAGERLDKIPRLYLEYDGELKTIGKSYGKPAGLLSATAVYEDEEVTMDLREFIPDNDWIRQHWRTIGSVRHSVNTSDVPEEDINWLEEVGRDDYNPEVVDTVFPRSKSSYTPHFVREVEEPVVDEEPERIRYFCGRVTEYTGDVLRLDVIPESIDLSVCGNCSNAR